MPIRQTSATSGANNMSSRDGVSLVVLGTILFLVAAVLLSYDWSAVVTSTGACRAVAGVHVQLAIVEAAVILVALVAVGSFVALGVDGRRWLRWFPAVVGAAVALLGLLLVALSAVFLHEGSSGGAAHWNATTFALPAMILLPGVALITAGLTARRRHVVRSASISAALGVVAIGLPLVWVWISALAC